MSSNNENDYKAKLIAVVKKEVKQLMEESVTRKFVHEESGSVTALCGAVEACLSQGLRRRALGLFKTSSTTALLHKIAKHCKEAAIISKKVQEIENSDPNRRSSSSSDSLTKPSSSSSSITTTTTQTTTTTTTTSSASSTQTTQSSTTSLKRTSPTLTNLSSLQQQQLPKYLWIRLALFEKQLSKIIDYLVANATKYYDKDALVADPDYGSILSSLLVGPCALDYSHTKTQDHYWTDPPADELVQRHRISSGGHITPPSIRRPILNFRRSLNTSSDDPVSVRNNQHQHLAKDYVESLHQNSRATLLFGKNNVLVLPINAVDITQPIPGYLSLHQTANGLIIKWTPNQLMNGFTSDDCASQQQQQQQKDQQQETNVYWDYALQVRLDEIVYVHCHQDSETGGTIILVGQDGVQRPPIHFPRGGHMLAFLSCIETGLLPRGRLDPPLWSQRTNNNNNNNNSSNSGNGTKNVTNRKRRPLPALAESEETTTQITKDYVFRIVDNSSHKEILKRNELMDRHISFPNRVRIQLPSTSTSSDSSTKSFSIEQQQNSLITDDNNSPPPTVCIQAVCDSMKRQIISRAFYGWLAYCRHLSTVRTHLSGLVNSKIINGDDNDVKNGITIEKWSELCTNGIVDDYNEVYRLTYFGGIAHDLRKDIWPYLLGHYKFGSTVEQRNELSEETKQAYENTMSEWLAVEAIVRQRDKETQANAIAKLSSESTSGEQPPPTHIPRDLSNDVFEDMSDDDDSAPVIDDTTQHPKRTKQNTIQYESDDGENADHADNVDNAADDDECTKIDPHAELKDFIHNVIVTNASVDMSNLGGENDTNQRNNNLDAVVEENNSSLDTCIETHGLASPARSACVSPASSNGGVYSQELLETFGLNLHRIEKDVQRCDRNYWYFAGENLDKLRNVMCTYVWEHLNIGYMQGMCDLVAPLLVIFNDESLTYACFCHLMERMVENFPNGNQMDCHFANMRSLIQILDSEMYELMHQQGDYTHFYFCYRWFLLDFKRELIYPDIFTTWEIIWAAQYVSSNHFVLFIALALLETYRDIILSNGMDFTDIIKFFNEMAEHHDAQAVLRLARELVLQLQLLIENK